MIKRPRLTEEQLKSKYEGIPCYEAYQWYKRRGLEVPEWALECKEMMHHKYLYLEDKKRNNMNQHVKANGIIKKLGIKSLCREIHHFAGSDNWKTFIYIQRYIHKRLHQLYGMRNEDVGIDVLMKHRDEIIQDGYALVVDGKLVEYTEHLTPSGYKMYKLGMTPVLVDKNSSQLFLRGAPGLGGISKIDRE